jgi:hypothetical protein
MPNKLRRDKNGRRGSRRGVARIRPDGDSVKPVDSVKNLLARSTPVLASIGGQAARQRLWRAWLAEHVQEPLRAHVSGIVEREGTLVLYAESAGWGVRLRYAMAELEVELRREHPQVTRIAVRVLPAGNADDRKRS